MSQHLGNLKSLLTSVGIIAISLAAIPLIPRGISWQGIDVSFILFMINTFTVNLGLSVGQPTFQALVTNSVSDQKQGAVTGLDESLLAIGRGVSPILAGGLYSIWGRGLFIFLALFLVVPYLWAWRAGRLDE